MDEHPQANEQHRSEPLPRNALPNGLIDDERIGMTGLYLAAYRASQGPGFALNVTDVHKRFRIGTTAFYTAIRQLKQTGWYARYQPRTSEPRQFARDHIVNRQIGRTGYLISKSEWFERDASSATSPLTTKEMAVWLFMSSHAPTFKIRAYTIRDRFDITRQTATKLLRRLEAAGLIWRVNAERQAGRFTMVEYTAHEPQGGRNSTVLNLPGTVGPDAGRRDTYLGLSCRVDTSIAPDSILVPTAEMEIEAHKDPDIWIWDQPIGTDIQYQHLKSAAACPFDNEDRSLLAKKNVVKRLRMAAKSRVNPKLLDRHGIRGFWTLVVYITFSRPWITIEEAIDHVIYVTQTWHENSASWINGWAYIGRPVVEDIIPFRQQIPQLLNELKASAEEWGWVTYIDKKILHGRTGLEEFMTAFNHDQDEMLEAFYVGLRALHMTTLREQSGPYVATSWRYFTTRHKLKLKMEEVRAGIPNDCPGNIHMISFTYDLDGFETFWRKAQNVDVARAAIWRAFQSEPALRDWLLIANYLDDDDSQDPPS